MVWIGGPLLETEHGIELTNLMMVVSLLVGTILVLQVNGTLKRQAADRPTAETVPQQA
jgi:hypothetical protein